MVSTIMEKQVVVDARTEATAWEGKARQQKLQQVTSGIIIIREGFKIPMFKIPTFKIPTDAFKIPKRGVQNTKKCIVASVAFV